MAPIKSILMFEALTLHGFKKNGLEFFRKKISKSLSIFSSKNGVFGGFKPGPLESPVIQLMVHQKIFGGY